MVGVIYHGGQSGDQIFRLKTFRLKNELAKTTRICPQLQPAKGLGPRSGWKASMEGSVSLVPPLMSVKLLAAYGEIA